MSWVNRGGYDWQLIDSAAESTVVTLGATLGYGLIDEPAEEYGTLRTFVGAVRAELARPVELVAGMVSVPEALVDVSADVVTVAVRGEREVVASAWRRLAGFFRQPLPAEDVTPTPVNEFGWPRDAMARCGLNAFTMTMISLAVPPVPVERLDRLREQLDPSRGVVRCVFFTTDDGLVGLDAFAAPDPSQYVRPASNRGGGHPQSGNLRTNPGPVVFTVVVPRSRLGLAAALVLRSHFANSVRAITGMITKVGCSVHALGADQWITVVCEEMPAPPERVRAVTATVSTPFPDVLVDAVITEIAELDPTVHDRERRTLGLPDDAVPSATQLRTAVMAALQTVHIPAESAAEDISGYPSLLPDLGPQNGKQFHSWLVKRDQVALGLPDSITVGPNVLSQPVPRASSSFDTVDLDHAVLVTEADDGLIGVFDDRLRLVEFWPSAFRRGPRLASMLQERLRHVPRLRTAASTGSGDLRARITAGKRRVAFGSVVATLGLGFIVIMVLVQTLTSVDPVSARVDEGDTVALGGKATVTAFEFVVTPRQGDQSDVLVSVRFCGGDPIDKDGVDPEVHRSVRSGDFTLFNGTAEQGQATAQGGPTLQPATVRTGECTDGDLRFILRGETTGLRVAYQNGFGDDVVWYDR